MIGKRQSSTVALNALSNYLRFVVAIACTFTLTPFVVNQLGPQHYGLWTLVLCIAGYLELLDCGLSVGAMRFVAAADGAGPQHKNRLVSTLVWVAILVSVGVLACIAAVTAWLGVDVQTKVGSMTLLVLLMAGRVAVNVPLGIYMGVLFAEHRIWLVNLVRCVSVIAFSVGAYVLLSSGRGIISLGVLYVVAYSLEYVAYAVLANLTTPWLRLMPGEFDLAVLNQVAGFSASSLLANGSNVVLMRTDPLVVSSFLSLSAVTLYAVPLRITEQLFVLSKQLINVFSPLYAQLHGGRKRATIRFAFLTCSRLSFGMMVGIVVPAIACSRAGLVYWIGPEFADAWQVLSILLLAALLRVLQESSTNVLAMTGDHAYVGRVTVISAIVNVTLSFLLVRPFGLLGVAAATLISVAIVGCAMSTGRVCRKYRIPLAQFVNRVGRPTLIPIALQLLVISVWWRVAEPAGLLALFLMSLVSGIVYLISYALISLDAKEQQVVRDWCREVAWRLQPKTRSSYPLNADDVVSSAKTPS